MNTQHSAFATILPAADVDRAKPGPRHREVVEAGTG